MPPCRLASSPPVHAPPPAGPKPSPFRLQRVPGQGLVRVCKEILFPVVRSDQRRRRRRLDLHLAGVADANVPFTARAVTASVGPPRHEVEMLFSSSTLEPWRAKTRSSRCQKGIDPSPSITCTPLGPTPRRRLVESSNDRLEPDGP